MNSSCPIAGLLIAEVLVGSCATGRRPSPAAEPLVHLKAKKWPVMADDLDVAGRRIAQQGDKVLSGVVTATVVARPVRIGPRAKRRNQVLGVVERVK